jgi:hypothetical protein
VRITSEKDRDIPDYFWKGADRVVYLKDIGGDENNHVVVSDRRGGEPKDLTPFPASARRSSTRSSTSRADARRLNRRNKEVFDVYDLDLASGELKLVAENPGNITDWGTDHDGKVRYAVATDGVNQVYLYRDDASAPFKPVLTTNFRDRFAPQGFTPDNRSCTRSRTSAATRRPSCWSTRRPRRRSASSTRATTTTSRASSSRRSAR